MFLLCSPVVSRQPWLWTHDISNYSAESVTPQLGLNPVYCVRNCRVLTGWFVLNFVFQCFFSFLPSFTPFFPFYLCLLGAEIKHCQTQTLQGFYCTWNISALFVILKDWFILFSLCVLYATKKSCPYGNQKKRYQLSWNWSYRWLWPALWILELTGCHGPPHLGMGVPG